MVSTRASTKDKGGAANECASVNEARQEANQRQSKGKTSVQETPKHTASTAAASRAHGHAKRQTAKATVASCMTLPDLLRVLPQDILIEQFWDELSERDQCCLLRTCKDICQLCSRLARNMWVSEGLPEHRIRDFHAAARRFTGVASFSAVEIHKEAADRLAHALHSLLHGPQPSCFGSLTQLYLNSHKLLPRSTSAMLLQSFCMACPKLVDLSLCELDITGSTADAVFECLTRLRSLELMSCAVDAKALQHLSCLTGLTNLELNGVELSGSSDCKRVAASLAALTGLRSLVLEQDDLAKPKHLAVVQHLSLLTKLHWVYEHEEVEGQSACDKANATLAALTRLQGLRELHLPGLELTKQGLAQLQHLHNLTKLCLHSVNLSPTCPPDVGLPGLEEFEIDDADFEPLLPPGQILRLVGRDPSWRPALRRIAAPQGFDISCSGNGFTQDTAGVQQVADDLRCLLALGLEVKEVVLDADYQSSQLDVRPVLQALEPAGEKGLPQLKLLSMSLGRSHVKALCTACPHLQALLLYQCRLSSGTFMALLSSSSLHYICLNECEGHGSCPVEIAAALCTKPPQQQLSLVYQHRESASTLKRVLGMYCPQVKVYGDNGFVPSPNDTSVGYYCFTSSS